MNIRITRRTIYAMVAIAVAVGAVAAVGIFAHNFPAITVVTAVITTTCVTLTPASTTIVSGTTANMTFTCGSSPAFTVATGGGTATPQFTLPTGYTALYVLPNSAGCGSVVANAFRLVSGTLVTFPSGGVQYDYCAAYSNAPVSGLAFFVVAWSQ